ncbi:MAG: NADH-quinone oxidoreductase subunit J [Verrucomicrobiae bacterium]|nr:NADH-quinone oxidoreductase subunit J [Verrucomicrobiae bacterium]
MTLAFAIIAALIVSAAIATMWLRNLIHCVLAAAVTFIGLAAAYLQLEAQFVGLAQILIYVGAVAILIVFAILLTRGGEVPERSIFSVSWFWGGAIGVAVFALLVWAILHRPVAQSPLPPAPEVTVDQIGSRLMTKFVLPLEVLGLLLTAALIGAVIIAMRDEVAKTKLGDGELKVDETVAPPARLHPPAAQGEPQ